MPFPDRHIFVKPEVTKHIANALHVDIQYMPEVTWLTYTRILAVGPNSDVKAHRSEQRSTRPKGHDRRNSRSSGLRVRTSPEWIRNRSGQSPSPRNARSADIVTQNAQEIRLWAVADFCGGAFLAALLTLAEASGSRTHQRHQVPLNGFEARAQHRPKLASRLIVAEEPGGPSRTAEAAARRQGQARCKLRLDRNAPRFGEIDPIPSLIHCAACGGFYQGSPAARGWNRVRP